jgi:hypothetical protein
MESISSEKNEDEAMNTRTKIKTRDLLRKTTYKSKCNLTIVATLAKWRKRTPAALGKI